jgi:methionine-rich copper-binding protein CopC
MWLMGLVVAAMLPFSAFGHAKLLGTSPAMGEQLEHPPRQLTLNFNEAVQLGTLKLSTDGKDVPLTLDRGAAAAPQVTVTLPTLAPGTYRVQWSALTVDDGHVVKGTFSFVIAGAR